MSPDKAIDGDNNTGWNSGNVPWFSPQWIEIDLGQASTINQITGFVDQWPSGYTKHNIYLDGIFNFTWEGDTAYSSLLSYIFQSPVTAQKVKIETTISPSWVGWKEFQILQELPSVPTSVPEPLGFFGISAVAGLSLMLKRRQMQH
ncbi:hypothetical protein BST81_01085 [Leptolyngbya sp. 'hensonii']|nr:hypothetical protein BST81_01085 [Leptolyngbya sp. 'hensonii']